MTFGLLRISSFGVTSAALLVVAASLAPTPASASWELVLHAVSHHVDPPVVGRWNERNWGLGLRKELDSTRSLHAGAYRNSNFATSVYMIMDWRPIESGSLNWGLFGGVVSGYKGPLAAGLIARMEYSGVSATVRGSPKAHRTGSAVIAFEVGYQF
ncbi:hypothetical protein [Synechococcus sp. CS-1328]|uniref:hypothetical protein n=1 Tax=Synechococcus sp. CS-1328 TaxID=2847976 RepID=UPI00223C1C0A|nr:hypothetical protein [Synechococcus sp. CS-1328]MCT0224378.1 hypothetical protein [Synechococcus sp. CS-1328]